jgi:hypothetical protein
MHLSEGARFKDATPGTDMIGSLVCYRADGEREVVRTVIKSRGALHGMPACVLLNWLAVEIRQEPDDVQLAHAGRYVTVTRRMDNTQGEMFASCGELFLLRMTGRSQAPFFASFMSCLTSPNFA